MALSLLRKPGDRFYDTTGAQVTGGFLNYYQAGTSLLQNTYSDENGLFPNANPLALDANGMVNAAVYLGSALDYKEVLTSATSAVTRTFDNIPRTAVANLTAAQPTYTWSRLNVSAWTASTSYAVGIQVSNGGLLYRCTTAGISASSGGPTGTGGSIADGTVIWTNITSLIFNLTASQIGSAFEVDTSLASVTINLFSAGAVGSGPVLAFKKLVAANSLLIVPFGAETVEYAASFTMVEANRIDVLSAIVTSLVTGWDVLSEYKPAAGVVVGSADYYLLT